MGLASTDADETGEHMTQLAAGLSPTRSAAGNAQKVDARDLSKTFRNIGHGAGADVTEVLKGFDLTIQDGEFVALLGPSGCGKSTFLNIIAGLEDFNGGRLLLDGAAVRGVSKKVGVVFQSYALFPWLSVQKNVEVGLKIRGVPARERHEIASRVLQTVGLEGFTQHLPHRLSGGMRQRVAIARALAYDPEVLVLDEPFAALDAQTREFLQNELLRIWETGAQKKTILFVTHSIDEAIFLADRIAVMTRRPGRIKSLIDVNLPRPRDDSARATAEYGRTRGEVAAILQEEVSLGQ
jgi:NitT/TauT family transport system ATP-binding protein